MGVSAASSLCETLHDMGRLMMGINMNGDDFDDSKVLGIKAFFIHHSLLVECS